MTTSLKVIALSLLVATLYLFSACKGNQEDSAEQAKEENKEKFETNTAEENAKLMVDLVESQYYEIRLSRYAMQKSMNAEVKEIAGMLVTDHSAVLTNLQSLAMQKSISIPNEDSVDINKKIEAWDDKKPSDFDKAYTDEMADKHKASIDKMQKAVDDEDTDADIKAALNNTLPTVKAHLDKLNTCKENLKKY